MSLLVGLRWSFRDKDAGAFVAGATGATEDAALGASSAAGDTARHFVKPPRRA